MIVVNNIDMVFEICFCFYLFFNILDGFIKDLESSFFIVVEEIFEN